LAEGTKEQVIHCRYKLVEAKSASAEKQQL
jgi:hypothetical protein